MNKSFLNLIKNTVEILQRLIKDINIQRVFIIVLSLFLLLLIIPIYFYLDSKSYDVFMKYIKRPVKQDKSLILADIDDNTMNWLRKKTELAVSWPLPRNIHGDAIEVLADFGARAAIFDIELIEPSLPGINMQEFSEVKKELDQADYDSKYIKEKFNRIIYDQDQYFADRIKYFGKTYGSVNVDFDINSPQVFDNTQDEIIFKNNLAKYTFNKKDFIKSINKHKSFIKSNIADFPYQCFLDNFTGIGFTKVARDKDASIRNIALFMENNGYIVPQLAFRPFLDLYNIKKEQIDLSSNNYIVLKDVIIDNKKLKIKIPIYNGMMKINWPSGNFSQIFPYKQNELKNKTNNPEHFSYYSLLNYKWVLLKQFEDELNFFSYLDDARFDIYNLCQEYKMIKAEKERIVNSETLAEDFRIYFNQYFDDFLVKVKNAVSEDNIKKIQKEIANPELKVKFKSFAKSVNEAVDTLIEARKNLSNLENKICFIGYTATGTTDLGSTPFAEKFENVGTHPSVFNTILQRDFIYTAPIPLILIFTLLIFGLFIWVLIERKAMFIAITGFVSNFIVLIIIGIIYRFTNFFISPVIPFFYGFIAFIIMIALKFILSEHEKSFIRNAFDKYLSPAVIAELIKDPKRLELGGKKSYCTALFTDLQGFSTISEKFMDDPKNLVSLLNEYLSVTSEIILENRGTIDKYEGDAIIAFFGEPDQSKDHPFRACLSSIMIKQQEVELNKKLISKKIIDVPLTTRVGINTGNMIVGNMGSYKRLDYTMMGHSVNLAARLEGVNKQYGTFQLISEFTYNHIKDKIICRELDRVRVVNIKTPVRLYELISLKEELKSETKEILEIFKKALIEFENRNWKQAEKLFKEALSGNPNDGPSKIYIDRSRKFAKSPPADNWDGVFNLSTK